MTTILLLASFFLHAVSLLAIILLFTRQNRLTEVKEKQQKLVGEMEEMMAAYILEMKDENERFIQELGSAAEAQRERKKSQAVHMVQKEEHPAQPEGETHDVPVIMPNLQRARANKIYKAQQSPEASAESDERKESTISQLKKEGYSIEEIARKLDKGKTEVELALKFQQKQ